MTLLSILLCGSVTCVYRTGHSTHDVYQDLYRALLYSSLSVARSEVSTIVLIINTELYPGIPTTEKGKKCWLSPLDTLHSDIVVVQGLSVSEKWWYSYSLSGFNMCFSLGDNTAEEVPDYSSHSDLHDSSPSSGVRHDDGPPLTRTSQRQFLSAHLRRLFLLCSTI